MIRSHQRITVLLAGLLVGPACKTRDPLYCEGAPLDNCSICITFTIQLDTCELDADRDTDTDLMLSGDWIYNTDTHVLNDVVSGNIAPVDHARVKNGDMM